MRPSRLLTIAVLLSALGTTAACGSGSATAPAPVAAVSKGFHGVEPPRTVPRPQFVLHDTTGAVYDFRAETKGRPTYVYFGYTHCPDECPTAMADVAAALRKAGADLASRARVVFVTTDPARDTAPVLRRWLDQFSPTFVGLLGTPAEVAAAQTAAGVTPGYPEGPLPTLPGKPNQHAHKPGTAPHEHFGALGYSVAHSAVIYAYDAADRLPVVYPGGVTPSDIAADLPVLDKP